MATVQHLEKVIAQTENPESIMSQRWPWCWTGYHKEQAETPSQYVLYSKIDKERLEELIMLMVLPNSLLSLRSEWV